MNSLYGGDECVGYGDDLAPATQAEGYQNQREGIRSIGDADAMGRMAKRRKMLLELNTALPPTKSARLSAMAKACSNSSRMESICRCKATKGTRELSATLVLIKRKTSTRCHFDE